MNDDLFLNEDPYFTSGSDTENLFDIDQSNSVTPPTEEELHREMPCHFSCCKHRQPLPTPLDTPIRHDAYGEYNTPMSQVRANKYSAMNISSAINGCKHLTQDQRNDLIQIRFNGICPLG